MRLEKYLNLLESIEDKGIFKACFFAGVPGSGKTFVQKKITSGAIEPRVVNTDKMSQFLSGSSEIDGENFGDKAKLLSKERLVQFFNSLLPLWIDSTSSNPSSVLKRKGILKSVGYDTAMIGIDTSLETALERNRNRDKKVPEDFIKRTFEKIQPFKDYYKSEFNNFTVINNDEGALTEEVILNAYKKMEKFFLSDVENPIGQRLIEEMKEKGYKYLSDTDEYDMNDIQKLVDNGYKK